MNDNDIKNLFSGLKMEEPSLGFEERIIKNALTQRKEKQSYVLRYSAMAAMFLFIFSFGLMNFSSTEPDTAQEYAAMLEEGSIVSEDDIYGDIIVAYNF
jgi:hypothetical protein